MASAASKFSLLKSMFSEMVEKKQAQLIPKYYHPNFVLYTNGKTMGYEQFTSMHKKVYKTDIQYAIHYKPQTVVESGDKIAANIIIDISHGEQAAKSIEVILIAEYKDNLIYRVWELTYPDWTGVIKK